jgi:hypothetical protein
MELQNVTTLSKRTQRGSIRWQYSAIGMSGIVEHYRERGLSRDGLTKRVSTGSPAQAMARTPEHAPSVGVGRLLRLRAIAGTGVWRTADLTIEIVDRALAIVRKFDRAFPGEVLRPRVAPTDGGGLSVEWERSGRELLLHIEKNGATEWLLVDGDMERTEMNADTGALTTWLATGT